MLPPEYTLHSCTVTNRQKASVVYHAILLLQNNPTTTAVCQRLIAKHNAIRYSFFVAVVMLIPSEQHVH